MADRRDIRNFCIIAHIDHGKSTLADRMLELTGTVEKRRMQEQLLDSMELERERGITIKLQPVRMQWKGAVLNLIDTPGHVDFQYEVSRSLQAVEGAVLLVDATQGTQAQTVANLYLALAQDLTIIPVVNKIDLPAARVEAVRRELASLLGVGAQNVLAVSAKTGEGVPALLDAIVKNVPDAVSSANQMSKALRCLIFDSYYDDYKGVVAYVRVVDGQVAAGDALAFLGTGAQDTAIEVGFFTPEFSPSGSLSAGQIGYIATGLKNVQQARVGDTITTARAAGEVTALPGFAMPQPRVFAGIFPVQGDHYPKLREALAELQLSDASLMVQPEQNDALGQGFRCGFLGILHLDIVQERLRREWEIELVVTVPSVRYRVKLTRGELREVHTPAEWPDPAQIEAVEEQLVGAEVLAPAEHIGNVFTVMKRHEAALLSQEMIGEGKLLLRFSLPLRELVVDLHDALKSATAGYASLGYELTDWQAADVVKLSVLINREPAEALAQIVPRGGAAAAGRRLVERLKEALPRQMFAVPLQAAVGGTIVARETLPAMRKDVTGHLYGGDVTRKRKLLEKQKKGKKRLAQSGSVRIPPATYLAILKR
ncbi:MAG: elongation factor 4 [Candidatus Andersenbacteria bacterium]|nr:elongation factor 4 [Candidatus Andersenbacteria bacterium]